MFKESLHNTKNLETTYYVTDNKQSTDFFWWRDSGIRINIGLSNINMIPEFEDVNHESDNEYIENDPNSASPDVNLPTMYNQIREYHCRFVSIT